MKLAIVAIGLTVLSVGCSPRPALTSAQVAAEPTQLQAAPTVPPTAVPTSAPVVLPGVGNTINKGDWAIGLDRVTSAIRLDDDYSYIQADPGSTFVILDMRAKNTGNKPNSIRITDFYLTSPEGSRFTASSAYMRPKDHAKPITYSEVVQPGLIREFSVVFEVDPNIRSYRFTANGGDFQINLVDGS
jgi:hypothetical protein